MTPPIPFPFTLLTEPAVAAVQVGASCDFTYCYGGDWVQGYVGNYGMSFDGTNEYVAVNTLATSMQGKNTFSVAFWASGSAYGADPAAFVLSDGGVSSETFALYPYDNSGGNGFRVFYNGTSIINENDATRTGWNYFAYVQNGATDHKIYVNGQQEGTSITSKTLDAQLDLSGIGGEGTLAEYFSGELDEVAVWNVPLSSGSIAALYNDGTGTRADTVVPPDLPSGAWVPGKVGEYGLRFIYNTSNDTGGTSLNSTYVDIGGTTTNFARTQAYSITGWLKPNFSGGEADRIDIFANNVGGGSPQGWYVLGFQKKLYFFFGTSGTAYITRQTNAAVLDTTDWVHFAITYDGTSANTGIKIYINGSEAASTGGSSGTFNGTVDYNSARLRIGGMANGSSIFHRFPGIMDELAVWDVELDSGAASELYNSGNGSVATNVSSSDLVAYYDMESGPGNTTLIDRSANSNNGTLTNFDTTNTGSLMLYYDFEIGDSNPVSGNFPASTSVYDSVTASWHLPTTHTGTMTNMEVADFGAWDLGHNGKYSLNFSGAADQRVEVPTSTDIEFGNDSTFSIACWVSSSQGSLQGFVSKATQALPNNNGWIIGRTMSSFFGADNEFFASVRSGANFGFIFSDTAIDDGWHHMVFTRNGSTPGNTIMYIDGAAQTDTTMGGGAGSNPSNLTDSGTEMLLGRYWDQTTGYNLTGSLDEIAIWNVALDSGAVTELYNGGYGLAATNISSSNIVTYYSVECNGPGSPTLLDVSGRTTNNGTLTEMSTGSCGVG